MLKGQIDTFSLGEVFQSLAINNHSGTLKIGRPGSPEKLVYFEKGRISLFSESGKGSVRIGEMLIRLGRISREQLDEALEEQKETKEVLGKILLRKQYVAREDLQFALEKKIREELCDLFLWKDGHFEFHLDYFPDDQIDEMQKSTRISLDVNSVTMEGLRQLDEWSLIHKDIKTFNEILAVTRSRYEGSSPLAEFLLSHIDGVLPVKKLFAGAPGSRFECCKTLHELIESGYARLLTLEEVKIHAAKRMEERQAPQAAAFLQFAVELEPNDPELHAALGEALANFYQDDASRDAFLQGLRLLYDRHDHEGVTKLADVVLRRTRIPDEDLEKIVNSYLEMGDGKKASVVANQLVSSLQKRGELRKAAEILEPIAALESDDLNLKIQIATFLEKAGDVEEATKLLENVAENLEGKRRIRELIKILRLMLEFDPTREDLKEKITEMRALQEKLDRRRRKRVTAAGISIIVLCLLALVPFVYEVKARESFSHAQKLEEIGKLTDDFARAKAAYEVVVSRYRFSTKAVLAQSALDRISNVEATRLQRAQREMLQRKKEQAAKMQAMKQAVTGALSNAAAAVASGDLKKAHEIYREIKKDYAELAATKEIRFPVRISTYPPGADLTINDKKVGTTPFIYHYKPGSAAQIAISRASCESLYKTEMLNEQWELHYELNRSPEGSFRPVSILHQPIVLAGGRMAMVSRDGILYCVDPIRKTTVWQRSVGRFGDRLSDLSSFANEIYLGTVSAEVGAISAKNGNSRWVTRVSSPVLAAPAVSPDGMWVAVGTTDGSVEIIQNRTGALTAKFSTENEVIAKPLFLGDLLVAASTDNSLYGYSLPKRRLVFMEELSDDIVLAPCALEGRVAAATIDSKVHAFDVASRRTAWTWDSGQSAVTAIATGENTVYAGLSSGELFALSGQTGEVSWRQPVGSGAISGMLLYGKKLYLGLESGEVAAASIERHEILWRYRSDDAIMVPPVVVNGRLYFAGASGKVQFMEVLE